MASSPSLEPPTHISAKLSGLRILLDLTSIVGALHLLATTPPPVPPPPPPLDTPPPPPLHTVILPSCSRPSPRPASQSKPVPVCPLVSTHQFFRQHLTISLALWLRMLPNNLLMPGLYHVYAPSLLATVTGSAYMTVVSAGDGFESS